MSAEEKKTSKSDEEPTASTSKDSFQICSKSFDPLRALYDPSALKDISKKSVKTFDNLAIFEASLKTAGGNPKVKILGSRRPPSTSQAAKNTAETAVASTSGEQRRFLPHQQMIKGPGIKQRHQRNLFNKLDKFEGPLELLVKFLRTRTRVRVYTRNEKHIRGETTGFLEIFDKHWNIILTDVQETWQRRKYDYSENKICSGKPKDCTQRLRNLGINIPKIDVKSLNRKNVQCKRQIPKLMIRGEQIVLITVDRSVRV